jgi:hypothetical protein
MHITFWINNCFNGLDHELYFTVDCCVIILPILRALGRRAIKKANQRGLPGWLLFSFLELLVGLGDAIAFIFRVKLQGKMFGDFWAFFRQLNLLIGDRTTSMVTSYSVNSNLI